MEVIRDLLSPLLLIHRPVAYWKVVPHRDVRWYVLIAAFVLPLEIPSLLSNVVSIAVVGPFRKSTMGWSFASVFLGSAAWIALLAGIAYFAKIVCGWSGGVTDFDSAFKLMAYSSVPLQLLAFLQPALRFSDLSRILTEVIVSVYLAVLLYFGLTPLMNVLTSPGKRVITTLLILGLPFLLVILLVLLLLSVISLTR